MTDTDDNLFDDIEASEDTTQEVAEEQETPDAEANGDELGEGDEPGDKEETPATPTGEEKGADVEDGKMIPAHRLKAAVKDVQDKLQAELDAAKQQLAKYEAIPVPDKDADPEGYNLHVRMEASKTVMRELVTDYDEVITHYKTMADANPFLNEQVANHPIPAKFAYDIAKKDMEIREVPTLKSSDEWKQFQEWKKQQKTQQPTDSAIEKATKQVTASLTSKVPNLNKATSVSSGKALRHSDDDELFQGAL